MSDHLQKHLTRSLERILEEAHQSGELKLSGRKLKDFPKLGKYNLRDTVYADLSKNRFQEIPAELADFVFLERLRLHHNAIRQVPESVSTLQSLCYLDLSRNQLTTLPREICRLPLQTLLLSHNRLTSLPDELGRMSVLAELDAGCNQLDRLPTPIRDLPQLRVLHLPNNLLVSLPLELTYLKLVRLDVSDNRISTLPPELRLMKSLVELKLGGNPLTQPPVVLCARGKTHIFEYLEQRAARNERAREGRPWREDSFAGVKTSHQEHHFIRPQQVDLACPTNDQLDKPDKLDKFNSSGWSRRRNNSAQELRSGASTPSTISPGESRLIEDELLQSNAKLSETMSLDGSRELSRVQTYREYKEELRRQRGYEAQSVYKLKEQQLQQEVTIAASKKPVQKVQPSRVKQQQQTTDRKSEGEVDATSWAGEGDKWSFTMKREQQRAKEEAELIGRLREQIESRLRIALPEDMAPALADGVILCQLVNQVRPRSVVSIHVPSAQVPRLTTARCRRNLENFLEACRKIGVKEEALLDAAAIMDVNYMAADGLKALGVLVDIIHTLSCRYGF